MLRVILRIIIIIIWIKNADFLYILFQSFYKFVQRTFFHF